MIEALLNNKQAYEIYFKLYAYRFTHSSLSVEYDKLKTKSKNVENNLGALKMLLDDIRYIRKLYPHDIQRVAKIINQNISYISDGYRKVSVIIQGADFELSEPREIPFHMLGLFDSYYNIWNDLSQFEKEAMLHIGLIRIHPFEDGNGRTARIVTTFNLIKNDIAPIIITEDERKNYFSFISENNVQEFSKFIEEKSKEELSRIKQLIENNTFAAKSNIVIKSLNKKPL